MSHCYIYLEPSIQMKSQRYIIYSFNCTIFQRKNNLKILKHHSDNYAPLASDFFCGGGAVMNKIDKGN